jgi:hypothetical protein
MANQFDIIALTETWLDSSILNNELLPVGYKIFRRDREVFHGRAIELNHSGKKHTHKKFNFISVPIFTKLTKGRTYCMSNLTSFSTGQPKTLPALHAHTFDSVHAM